MPIKKSNFILILLVGFFVFPFTSVVQAKFKPPINWERIPMTREAIIKYLDENRNNLNPVEGIWNFSQNVTQTKKTGESQSRFFKNFSELAILKKGLTSGNEFKVIILSSMDSKWDYQGRLKAELRSTAYPKSYTVKWYDLFYRLVTSYFSINENGVMEGVLRYKYKPNIWATSEVTFIRAYPPYDGQTDSRISEKVKSSGSGFLISETGLLVTNYHVIEGAENIEIVFPDKNISKSAITKIKDTGNDLAILQIDTFDFSKISNIGIPYSLAETDKVKVGQEVFTLGFPFGSIMGTKCRLSTGRINSTYGIQENPRLFQIGNPLQPGNSGGPLFNLKGELVGVVVSGLNAKFFYDNLGIIPQNVNFAVKVNYLKNVLSLLPESNEITSRKNEISNLSLENQIEKLSPFIVQINAN